MLSAIEVLLVRLLLHRGEPELPVLLPLLLDRGLLARGVRAGAGAAESLKFNKSIKNAYM